MHWQTLIVGYKQKLVRVICIRRTLVLPHLVEVFKGNGLMKAEIKITMVDGRGRGEIGEDVKGVFRDALAVLWEECYLRCTRGVREKVPSLRHGIQSLDWTEVTLILVKGYFDVGYFPLMLFLPSVLNQNPSHRIQT